MRREKEAGVRTKLRRALRAGGSTIAGLEFERLADELERSIRTRAWAARRLTTASLGTHDIVRHIIRARDHGDLDEAFWLSFLAAHFGRDSADRRITGQIASAERFACAFGTRVVWTWKRVSSRPTDLRRWLVRHAADLRSLSFGNHRKFEAKQPGILWDVIGSFLSLAESYGGRPSAIFETRRSIAPTARYDELYKSLRPLWRFGRTARFDWLSLLHDLKLIEVQPSSCHLRGSTGPLNGARRLWQRHKSPRALERLADDLAKTLGLSPLIVEDCLCNWQKD